MLTSSIAILALSILALSILTCQQEYVVNGDFEDPIIPLRGILR